MVGGDVTGVDAVIGAKYWDRGGGCVVSNDAAANTDDNCATRACMAAIWSLIILLASVIVWNNAELAGCAAAKFLLDKLNEPSSVSNMILPLYPSSPAVLVTLLYVLNATVQ